MRVFGHTCLMACIVISILFFGISTANSSPTLRRMTTSHPTRRRRAAFSGVGEQSNLNMNGAVFASMSSETRQHASNQFIFRTKEQVKEAAMQHAKADREDRSQTRAYGQLHIQVLGGAGFLADLDKSYLTNPWLYLEVKYEHSVKYTQSMKLWTGYLKRKERIFFDMNEYFEDQKYKDTLTDSYVKQDDIEQKMTQPWASRTMVFNTHHFEMKNDSIWLRSEYDEAALVFTMYALQPLNVDPVRSKMVVNIDEKQFGLLPPNKDIVRWLPMHDPEGSNLRCVNAIKVKMRFEPLPEATKMFSKPDPETNSIGWYKYLLPQPGGWSHETQNVINAVVVMPWPYPRTPFLKVKLELRDAVYAVGREMVNGQSEIYFRIGGSLSVGAVFQAWKFGFEVNVGASLYLKSSSYPTVLDMIFAFVRYQTGNNQKVGETQQAESDKAMKKMELSVEEVKSTMFKYLEEKSDTYRQHHSKVMNAFKDFKKHRSNLTPQQQVLFVLQDFGHPTGKPDSVWSQAVKQTHEMFKNLTKVKENKLRSLIKPVSMCTYVHETFMHVYDNIKMAFEKHIPMNPERRNDERYNEYFYKTQFCQPITTRLEAFESLLTRAAEPDACKTDTSICERTIEAVDELIEEFDDRSEFMLKIRGNIKSWIKNVWGGVKEKAKKLGTKAKDLFDKEGKQQRLSSEADERRALEELGMDPELTEAMMTARVRKADGTTVFEQYIDATTAYFENRFRKQMKEALGVTKKVNERSIEFDADVFVECAVRWGVKQNAAAPAPTLAVKAAAGHEGTIYPDIGKLEGNAYTSLGVSIAQVPVPWIGDDAKASIRFLFKSYNTPVRSDGRLRQIRIRMLYETKSAYSTVKETLAAIAEGTHITSVMDELKSKLLEWFNANTKGLQTRAKAVLTSLANKLQNSGIAGRITELFKPKSGGGAGGNKAQNMLASASKIFGFGTALVEQQGMVSTHTLNEHDEIGRTCTFKEHSGTCQTRETCKGDHGFISSSYGEGAKGCGKMSAHIRCCLDEVATCQGSETGTCTVKDLCEAPHSWVSSKQAQGCHFLPPDMRCCVGRTLSPAEIAAQAAASQGSTASGSGSASGGSIDDVVDSVFGDKHESANNEPSQHHQQQESDSMEDVVDSVFGEHHDQKKPHRHQQQQQQQQGSLQPLGDDITNVVDDVFEPTSADNAEKSAQQSESTTNAAANAPNAGVEDVVDGVFERLEQEEMAENGKHEHDKDLSIDDAVDSVFGVDEAVPPGPSAEAAHGLDAEAESEEQEEEEQKALESGSAMEGEALPLPEPKDDDEFVFGYAMEVILNQGSDGWNFDDVTLGASIHKRTEMTGLESVLDNKFAKDMLSKIVSALNLQFYIRWDRGVQFPMWSMKKGLLKGDVSEETAHEAGELEGQHVDAADLKEGEGEDEDEGEGEGEDGAKTQTQAKEAPSGTEATAEKSTATDPKQRVQSNT
jgi:hypothetical protein